MRKWSLILILVMLMTPRTQSLPSPLQQNTTNDITVRVVVDSTFSDTSVIGNVASSFNGSTRNIISAPSYSYTNKLKIEVSTLSSEDHVSLVNFLNSINVSDRINGNVFNATAFNAGLKNESFYGRQGHSYNASTVLQWMADNLWDGRRDAYTFFVLNLTELDTGGMEHWFSIFPRNMDTGQFDPGFFSSASGLTYGREVMGWGGENGLPIQFLDLSASGWYGDFINTAWNDYGWNPSAIDKKLQDWSGLETTSAYKTWLTNLFAPFMENLFLEDNSSFYVFQSDLRIMRVVEIQNIVFVNWTDSNISDVKWVIHNQLIEELFESTFPWLDFQVTTIWKQLSSNPELKQVMEDNMVYNNETGKYEIEVTNGFLNYVDYSVIPKYFREDNTVIQLPSVTFLNPENVAMTYLGVYFAGLGGMGWQLQSVSPSRLLNQDGTPREGLSSVMSHEIGHSLGLPHPFYYGQWASDFTSSIMGYYPEVSTFSTFDQNKIARTMSYYYMEKLKEGLAENPMSSNYNAAELQLTSAQDALSSWEFTRSIHASLSGLDLLANGTTTSSSTTSTSPPITSSTTTTDPTTSTVTTTNSTSEVQSTPQNPLPLAPLFTVAPLLIAIARRRKT